jgi:hypothetical protein
MKSTILGDLPQSLHDAYQGPLSDKFVDDFAYYADKALGLFGGRVKTWLVRVVINTWVAGRVAWLAVLPGWLIHGGLRVVLSLQCIRSWGAKASGARTSSRSRTPPPLPHPAPPTDTHTAFAAAVKTTPVTLTPPADLATPD